jgi:ribosome-associated protein
MGALFLIGNLARLARSGRRARSAERDFAMPRPLIVTPSLTIPGTELQLSYARSAGPGGQNVNKVNTKAVLRWAAATTPSLPDDVRRRLLERYANRLNAEGELVIAADEHREQSRNISACYDRLRQMITSVLRPPRKRVKTRPSRAAVERRIEAKQRRSSTKEQRRYRPEA